MTIGIAMFPFRKSADAAVQLTNLDITKVSGVDRGANGLEGFAVLKSENGATAEFVKQAVAVAAAADIATSVIDQAVVAALDPTVAKGLADGFSALAAVTKEAEVAEALTTASGLLASVHKEAPPVPDNQPFDPASLTGDAAVFVKSLTDKVDEVTKALETAQADLEKAKAPPVADDDADDVEKALASVPEPLRKAFADMQARALAQEQVAKDALAKALEERDARLEATYLAKAETSGCALETDLLAKAMRAADESGSEPLAKAFGELVAQNAELAKQAGIFKSSGVAGAGPSDSYAKIDEVAKSLMAADPKMTKAQAIDRVYDTHPELIANYRSQEG